MTGRYDPEPSANDLYRDRGRILLEQLAGTWYFYGAVNDFCGNFVVI